MNYIKFLEILCLCVGIFSYTRIHSPAVKVVIYIVGITVLNELVFINLIKHYSPTNRNFTYNIFSILEKVGWLAVFYIIHKSHRAQKFIIPAALLLFALMFYEFWLPGGSKKFNVGSFCLFGLVVIVFSFLYLRQLLKIDGYHPIFRDCIFWICAACILFYGLSIINFILLQEVAYWKSLNSIRVFYLLHNIANTFYYLLLCISFLTCAYYKKL